VLGRLGYGTRPTINNGVAAGAPTATDLKLSLSLFDEDGRHLGTSPALGRLAPEEIVKLDLDELLTRPEVRATIEVPAEALDPLAVVHLVPADLVGETSATIPTRDMMAHVFASDDFVEFHQKPRGVITGVAYQTGQKNDPRLGSTQTTVVQAPKVIVSDAVDTLFALMNVSTSFGYDREVSLDFWILGPGGERIARSSIAVPPFAHRLLSVTEVLEEAGALDRFRALGGMGMLLGYAKDGTLVPLSLTRQRASGAIACDHTLPPVFYISTWGGQARLDANARLAAEFFPEPVLA
jgi:hypothetical protein